MANWLCWREAITTGSAFVFSHRDSNSNLELVTHLRPLKDASGAIEAWVGATIPNPHPEPAK